MNMESYESISHWGMFPICEVKLHNVKPLFTPNKFQEGYKAALGLLTLEEQK
jgi:hypothetical protein